MDGKKVLGVLLKALEAEYKVQFLLNDTQVSASGAQNQMTWDISVIEPAVGDSPAHGDAEPSQAESGRILPLLLSLPEIAIDPLESAISSTAGLIADERERLNAAGLQSGSLASALMEQMNRLLAIQVERVGSIRRDAVVDAVVSDIYGLHRRGM